MMSAIDMEIGRLLRALIYEQDKACTGKAKFVQRRFAVPVAERISRKHAENQNIYHCRFCHCWHIGSDRWIQPPR